MSSKSKNSAAAQKLQAKLVFSSLVGLSLIFWILYRYIFSFPIIFDETIGKAIFFGLPVLIYASVAKTDAISKALDPRQVLVGLLRGLAYGGIIGFVGVIVIALNRRSSYTSFPVFLADRFWIELLLATFTAFWESVFFFGFVQAVLAHFWKFRGKVRIWGVSSLIFLLFHLPNIMLRFAGLDVTFLIFLMYLFGLGQAILFDQEENIYPLIITHTVWGMILLIHF